MQQAISESVNLVIVFCSKSVYQIHTRMQDNKYDVIFRWIPKNMPLFEDIIKDKDEIRKTLRTTKPVCLWTL